MKNHTERNHEPHATSNRICLEISHMNGDDAVHNVTLGNALFTSLKEEAGAHGADFNENGFKKVTQSIRNGKIRADFIIVSTENCRPAMAGCAVLFPSVHTDWTGKEFIYSPAIYIEDFFISPDASKSVRAETISETHPNGIGLGTIYLANQVERATTETSDTPPFFSTSGHIIVEHAIKNDRAINLLKKFGAQIENNVQSAVLEFTRPIPKEASYQISQNDLYAKVSQRKKRLQPNAFVCEWVSNKGAALSMSFTDAISTFSGESVIRAQILSNGLFPREAEMRSALTSLINSGIEGIVSRDWTNEPENHEKILSSIKIHTKNEPEVASCLMNLGATPRHLGNNIMMPTTIDCQTVATETLGKSLPESIPFILGKTSQPDRYYLDTDQISCPLKRPMTNCQP